MKKQSILFNLTLIENLAFYLFLLFFNLIFVLCTNKIEAFLLPLCKARISVRFTSLENVRNAKIPRKENREKIRSIKLESDTREKYARFDTKIYSDALLRKFMLLLSRFMVVSLHNNAFVEGKYIQLTFSNNTIALFIPVKNKKF